MAEDIYSLLGRYFSNEASVEEEAAVQQWMRQSAANEEEFHLLRQLWTDSAGTPAVVFDTEKAWTRVGRKISISQQPAGGRTRVLRLAMGIAASLILVLGSWWIWQRPGTELTIVADNGTREISLADGSRVYLRKGSSLRYDKGFEQREVELKGEGFFDVKPDATRPFIITAANTEVKVLGTSFSVNTANSQVELIVKTGRVQFSAPDENAAPLLVTAGERALFSGGSFSKTLNTDTNFNAWQSGALIFNRTPVNEVAAALSRYYGINVTLKKQDSAQLSAASVTARFVNQPLSDVLEELSLITSYRIQKTSEGNYEISIN
ncbi:MAG TPA: FecR domain-containing protein [Flavisolibacter sp.]|nr:FecR domain-containing protein [Flavisolibacter sp.]